MAAPGPAGAGAFPRRHASTACSLGFVVLVLAAAVGGGAPAVAVYALGFWHYLLYALAFGFGRVAPGVFRRDAVLMKGVSLAGLGVVYLAAPLDALSLAVVAAGFLLNLLAARALGAERTYYGREVAGLPALRVTAFPYSLVPHPMLLGNVLAFAGTLINAEFRAQWWPLALAHVGLNLGLLAMELGVTPRRGAAGGPALPGGSLAIALAALFGGAAGFALGRDLLSAGIGALAPAYAAVLLHCYAGAGDRHQHEAPRRGPS